MSDFVESLVVTSTSHTHQILQFDSLSTIHSFSKTSCPQNGVTFVEETQNVIIVGERGQILVYSFEKDLPLYQCVQDEQIQVIHHSNTFLFGGSIQGNIYIWNLSSGELWFVLKNAHMKAVSAIKYHETTGFLITASEDASVRVWNLLTLLDIRLDPEVSSTRSIIHEWNSHSLKVTSIYCGEYIIATASLDRSVKLWDIQSGEELCNISFPSTIQDIQLSPDEKIIYAAGSNGFIYEVSLYGTGFDIRYMDSNHISAIVKPVVSLVGGRKQLIVEHTSNQKGNVFNIDEFKSLVQKEYSMCYIYQGHTNSVTSISLSLDGCKLASCSLDGNIIVWDVQMRQPIRTVKKGTGSTEAQFTNISTIRVSQQARENKTSLRKTFKKFVVNDPASQIDVHNRNIHSDWYRIWNDEKDKKMDLGIFGDSVQLAGGLNMIENIPLRNYIQNGIYTELNQNYTISNELDENESEED